MSGKLHTPYEIDTILKTLPAYVSVCFHELVGGSSLATMNQRKQRAIISDNWEKYINIGLAVELYKQTKLMNEKKAY